MNRSDLATLPEHLDNVSPLYTRKEPGRAAAMPAEKDPVTEAATPQPMTIAAMPHQINDHLLNRISTPFTSVGKMNKDMCMAIIPWHEVNKYDLVDTSCLAGVESTSDSCEEVNTQQAGAGENINCIVVSSFPVCACHVEVEELIMTASNQLNSQPLLRPVPNQ